MKNAGLILNPTRGKVSISDAGRKVLQQKPTTINCKFLKQFPSYLTFIGQAPGQSNEGKEETVLESIQTNTASVTVRGGLASGIRASVTVRGGLASGIRDVGIVRLR